MSQLLDAWYTPLLFLLAIWTIGVLHSIVRIKNKPLAKWRKYVIEQEKNERGTSISNHGSGSSNLPNMDQ